MGFTSILYAILNFNSWLYFILILYLYKSQLDIMYEVSFIYSNLIRRCFTFVSFQGNFFHSPGIMDFFHCYHRQWISFPWNLSISASPTSVTTHSYRCYRQKFNPKLSYFHHLEGGRVSAVHEKASPNENAKQTAIHHRSQVPRGRFARPCMKYHSFTRIWFGVVLLLCPFKAIFFTLQG